MSAHTPGPWAIVRQDALLVEDGHVAQVGNQYEVRPLPGVPIGDEAADLALISAAPELLAALQEATRCLAWHEEKHGVGMDRLAVQKAIAAIAKAEGKP